jgi:sugar O-acyltransferase (sialic acid O-acetyltransferase NeuD family)
MSGGVPPRRWLIYACRTTFAPEVLEVVLRCGDEVEALVDNLGGRSSTPMPRFPAGVPVVEPGDLSPAQLRLAVVAPPLTPGHRHAVMAEVRARGLSTFPALLDPSAVISSSVEVGDAVLVNAGVVVGANSRLGFGTSVNRSASLGHDNVVDDFATIGPCASTAGHVHVGRGAFLGVGSVCAPEVRIGENAVVGAGAVVVRDVEPGAVVVGNPARTIRTGPGFGGVAVPC